MVCLLINWGISTFCSTLIVFWKYNSITIFDTTLCHFVQRNRTNKSYCSKIGEIYSKHSEDVETSKSVSQKRRLKNKANIQHSTIKRARNYQLCLAYKNLIQTFDFWESPKTFLVLRQEIYASRIPSFIIYLIYFTFRTEQMTPNLQKREA